MAAAASFLPAAVTVASSLMGAAGSASSATGARTAASRVAVAKQFEATQLRINAGQEIAASQRTALEERRQATLVASRQLALAAASGAGASDTTVVQLISRTAKEGSYRAAVALYGGNEKARQLRMAAAGRDYEAAAALEGGEQQAGGYEMAGLGSLFKGATSLFTKYGMGGPKSGDDAAVASGGVDWNTPMSSGEFGLGAGV